MRSKTFRATCLAAMIAALVASGGVAAHGGGGLDHPMGDGMMDGHKMGHGMLAGQGMSHGMGHGMIGGSATMSGHGMIGGPATMGGHGMIGGPATMGGHGMMGGPAMMSGHGMMGGHVDGGPTLSVEQRKQMSRIQTALRKHNWALQGDIIDARGELFDLYIEETPNAKKIGAVYAKIFDLRRQMIEATIDAQNRVRAIVTTE